MGHVRLRAPSRARPSMEVSKDEAETGTETRTLRDAVQSPEITTKGRGPGERRMPSRRSTRQSASPSCGSARVGAAVTCRGAPRTKRRRSRCSRAITTRRELAEVDGRGSLGRRTAGRGRRGTPSSAEPWCEPLTFLEVGYPDNGTPRVPPLSGYGSGRLSGQAPRSFRTRLVRNRTDIRTSRKRLSGIRYPDRLMPAPGASTGRRGLGCRASRPSPRAPSGAARGRGAP